MYPFLNLRGSVDNLSSNSSIIYFPFYMDFGHCEPQQMCSNLVKAHSDNIAHQAPSHERSMCALNKFVHTFLLFLLQTFAIISFSCKKNEQIHNDVM